MLVQLPLLAACGWLLGRGLPPTTQRGRDDWNRFGVPGLLLAAFTAVFWLLPRWLDAALQEPFWEGAKFVTLPLLLGLPLARSWWRFPGVGRAIVWAHVIVMLAVMGWLYHAAPERLCNSYLFDQQELLARSLLTLAAVLGLFWTLWSLLRLPGDAAPQNRP